MTYSFVTYDFVIISQITYEFVIILGHTTTHMLNYALHEALGADADQVTTNYLIKGVLQLLINRHG